MNATGGDNFRQSELDKFGALAQRWWGERRAVAKHRFARAANAARASRGRVAQAEPCLDAGDARGEATA